MIYRETGQFKPSYRADSAVFPIGQDRWVVVAFVIFLMLIPPMFASEYLLQAILVPTLIYSIAAIGLNLLTGYCGQLSLGTGGFMAVGAVACYKLSTAFPEMNLLVVLFMSGLITAGVGLIFGVPSLRIKGFYLAVATLAAQFFLSWLFNKVAWFQNYTPSGTLTMPPREVFGYLVTGAAAEPHHRYLFCYRCLLFRYLTIQSHPLGRHPKHPPHHHHHRPYQRCFRCRHCPYPPIQTRLTGTRR